MNGCDKRKFPSVILPKLSHLQVFILKKRIYRRRHAPVTVKGNEVGCLRKLEDLECHFEGHSDFVEYLKTRDETQSLSTYKFFVGSLIVLVVRV